MCYNDSIKFMEYFSMRNVKIPKQFTIIQNREDMIEFKSIYHYWRISKINEEIMILSHKYEENHNYHKQFSFSCTDFSSIFRYIIRHAALYNFL